MVDADEGGGLIAEFAAEPFSKTTPIEAVGFGQNAHRQVHPVLRSRTRNRVVRNLGAIWEQ